MFLAAKRRWPAGRCSKVFKICFRYFKPSLLRTNLRTSFVAAMASIILIGKKFALQAMFAYI